MQQTPNHHPPQARNTTKTFTLHAFLNLARFLQINDNPLPGARVAYLPTIPNEEITMTPAQKDLVRTTWAQVVPIKEKAAELFYGKLFELDPAVKPMFKNDMAEQGKKLMMSINTVVNSLDRLEPMVPILQDMGRRHKGHGVQDAHYDTVGTALLWTLETGLGPAFTPEVKSAWTEAYTLIATVMKDAANAA